MTLPDRLERACGCPECAQSGESHGPTCGCRACNPDGTFFEDPSMPDGYCQVGVYVERLSQALEDVGVRLDQIERDRRESDKVLLGVHAARMVLTRLTLDENSTKTEAS